MRAELAEIADALGNLTEHMDKSLPEERVKALLENTTAEEHRSRHRLSVLVRGLVIIAALILVSSGLLLLKANDSVNSIKEVATFIDHCLKHPDRLTPAQRQEECGALAR